jgi:hypothetical protein
VASIASSTEISNLKAANDARLKATHDAPMNERLARLHRLCKQMSAIKGSAVAR